MPTFCSGFPQKETNPKKCTFIENMATGLPSRVYGVYRVWRVCRVYRVCSRVYGVIRFAGLYFVGSMGFIGFLGLVGFVGFTGFLGFVGTRVRRSVPKEAAIGVRVLTGSCSNVGTSESDDKQVSALGRNPVVYKRSPSEPYLALNPKP